MKIYVFTQKFNRGDQYVSMAVLALNVADARDMASRACYYEQSWSDADVAILDGDKPGIILAAYDYRGACLVRRSKGA